MKAVCKHDKDGNGCPNEDQTALGSSIEPPSFPWTSVFVFGSSVYF